MDPLQQSWKRAGWLVAIGGAVLMVGLLSGPTPSEDPAQALRDIDGFHVRWVVTNAIDFGGLALLVVGLSVLARLQAAQEQGFVFTSAANLGVALGGLLIAVVLVAQSTVEVGIASSYVTTTGAEQSAHLILGRAILDLEGGLFGLGLLLFMVAVASGALALQRSQVVPLNSGFLYLGVALALIAGVTGAAFLIGPLKPFGRLEPFFALATLVWLIALGVLLARSDVAPA